MDQQEVQKDIVWKLRMSKYLKKKVMSELVVDISIRGMKIKYVFENVAYVTDANFTFVSPQK